MTSTAPTTEGYLNDQLWTFGYHSTLSPHYLNLALAFAGRDPIHIKNYCELAFGHGVSLVIHAAANPRTQFEGTDFNPIHLECARRLAGDDVPNLSLRGFSFSDFFQTAHGGPFDAVAMVGAWSWAPGTEQRKNARAPRCPLATRRRRILPCCPGPGQGGSGVPWRSDCLVQSLAADRWLERKGIAHDFRLGVREGDDGLFLAHAWIEVDGIPITGGDDIDDYRLIVSS